MRKSGSHQVELLEKPVLVGSAKNVHRPSSPVSLDEPAERVRTPSVVHLEGDHHVRIPTTDLVHVPGERELLHVERNDVGPLTLDKLEIWHAEVRRITFHYDQRAGFKRRDQVLVEM